jgi:hypothetical protein
MHQKKRAALVLQLLFHAFQLHDESIRSYCELALPVTFYNVFIG